MDGDSSEDDTANNMNLNNCIYMAYLRRFFRRRYALLLFCGFLS